MRLRLFVAAAVAALAAGSSWGAPAPVAQAVVGGAPTSAAFNPVTHLWYVANGATNDVSVLAGAGAAAGVGSGPGQAGALAEVARVPVGKSPQGVAIHSVTGLVFVSSYDTDSITVLSGPAVVASIPAGKNPWGLAVDSGADRLCVANFADNNVSIIDTTSRAVLAKVATFPGPIGVAAGGGKCYVTSFYGGTVQAISLTSNPPAVLYTATTVTGRTDTQPRGVALSADGLTLYVANSNDASVSFLNPVNGGLLVRVPLDAASAPLGVAASARTIYITESALTRVVFMNPVSRAFVTRATGATPVAVGVGSNPECAAVANLGSDSASLYCDVP